jgi:hypothetical protein
MIETHSTTTPVCPWCGYAYTWGDATMLEDGLRIEQPLVETCVKCGKKFWIEIKIDVLYTTGRPS